jgi:mannose-6-phosphate isomerase-like protein (cupin superfamily)
MSDGSDLQSIEGPTTYDRWVAGQGIPLVTGLYVESLSDVTVGDWDRRGARGAIVRLDGCEDRNDAHILELAPGGQTTPERHLYEEFVYVVEGRGSTSIWNNQGAKSTFEWQAGSLFAVPLNTWSQHFNGSGADRARFYCVTTAPLMMNLFHNQDLIFECDFDFTDRFGEANDDFSGNGTTLRSNLHDDRPARWIWDTKFIADVTAIELKDREARGPGAKNIILEIADSSMVGHIGEFPVGRYKKAHRHQAGAHVVILTGHGYSLLWHGDQPKQQVDWRPGSVLVPADKQFHQHFNTGPTPTRLLALRWNGKKYPVFKGDLIDVSTRKGGDQIEYYDEDPAVRRTFEEELAKYGVKPEMDDSLYTPPAD